MDENKWIDTDYSIHYNNCLICGQSLSDTQRGKTWNYTTDCNHVFHFTCLMNSYWKYNECPQCKKKIFKQMKS